MAIDGYTVNGSALVYTGTGNAGALELLGFTENGVDMSVQTNKGEILTDIYGPMTPQDFQDFGMTARVVCPFIALDRTVLNKALKSGDATTAGQLNTPGKVIGVAGWAYTVAIAAPLEVGTLGWIFAKGIIRPGFGTRLGVKAVPFRIEFYCWPYSIYTVTTGLNATLYTRGIVPGS